MSILIIEIAIIVREEYELLNLRSLWKFSQHLKVLTHCFRTHYYLGSFDTTILRRMVTNGYCCSTILIKISIQWLYTELLTFIIAQFHIKISMSIRYIQNHTGFFTHISTDYKVLKLWLHYLDIQGVLGCQVLIEKSDTSLVRKPSVYYHLQVMINTTTRKVKEVIRQTTNLKFVDTFQREVPQLCCCHYLSSASYLYLSSYFLQFDELNSINPNKPKFGVSESDREQKILQINFFDQKFKGFFSVSMHVQKLIMKHHILIVGLEFQHNIVSVVVSVLYLAFNRLILLVENVNCLHLFFRAKNVIKGVLERSNVTLQINYILIIWFQMSW